MRSDDVTSRRVVRAFIDFLNSVEAAPGVDIEGLEVAKDCLTQVFGLDHPTESDNPEPNLLLNLFNTTHDRISESETKTTPVEDISATPRHADAASNCSSSAQNANSARLGDDAGMSKDELFGQFFDALEKIYFFRTTNGDDHVLLDKATCLFHDAVNELENSGCNLLDRKSLADALKTLGNKSMQSKLYADAVERYTCAIALCGNNAVFYCNRAAAYTQMQKYSEAVKDCLKSIELNPTYSKAYSRLGLAYYAQGNYSDAINRGFKKALELDPNNDAVKENIRAAEQKLIQQEQRNRFQNGESRDAEHNHGGHDSYFDGNNMPEEFASMFRNVVDTFQAQESHNRSAEQTHGSEASNLFFNMTGQGSRGQSAEGQPQGGSQAGPGLGVNAGFTYAMGGQTLEELNRTLRSVMGMGGLGVPQGDVEGRPESR